jgi:hypothetical protein
MFTLEANFDAFERSLQRHAAQVPFAVSLAINDTLADVKRAEERRLPLVLDRPTPFTRKGLMIRRATKQRLAGEVRYKDIQRGYLMMQETGGERRPSGRALVVPVGQRLNQYGNLSRGAIRRLLSRPDVFSGEVNGVGGIWQRPRKAGGRLKLLIAYEPKARYRPRLGFERSARIVATRTLRANMARAWRKAIQTAR